LNFIKIGRLYDIAAIGTIGKLVGELYETNFSFCVVGISLFVFLYVIIIAARVYKLGLAEVNFLSCFISVSVPYKIIA